MTRSALHPNEGTINGEHYLASTPGQVSWGWLPTVETPSPLTMRSGQTVTIDTVSHEGILEDQGRDPVGFFGAFGVHRDDVLARRHRHRGRARRPRRARQRARTWSRDPFASRGAHPGDVLKVEFLELTPRVQYGIISSRHGYGSLPGEMPPLPHAGFVPDPSDPARAGAVCKFCSVDGDRTGSLSAGGRRSLRFPLAPFLGLVGVTPAATKPLHSVPPGPFGGNMDVRDLVAGSSCICPCRSRGRPLRRRSPLRAGARRGGADRAGGAAAGDVAGHPAARGAEPGDSWGRSIVPSPRRPNTGLPSACTAT